MAANGKKRRVKEEAGNNHLEDDSENESDHSNDLDLDENTGETDSFLNEQIQVDFEARTPEGSDFHGIKKLLEQLFVKTSIDLSALTDVILQQTSVSSVIKQSEMPEESDDDDDDDTFGVMTVLNLQDDKNPECIQQLRTFLLDKCGEVGDEHTLKNLKTLLQSGGNVGLIVSERCTNIPAQIAVPMYKNLRQEIQTARRKGKKYDFSHYVLICKEYQTQPGNGRRNSTASETIIFSNPEEELLLDDVQLQFKYSIEGEAGPALSGLWGAGDDSPLLVPYRRIVLFPDKTLDEFIEKIESSFPT